MSFYSLSDGSSPTGSEEDSNASVILTVFDNTFAKAKITACEIKIWGDNKYVEVRWQLIDTKFKGIFVTQKIKVFEQSGKARDRAINMLVRLYKIANLKLSHSDAPGNSDLAMLKGRVMGIKIQQWFYQGKEGNWVSEVHSAEEFTSKEGVLKNAPAENPLIASNSMPIEAYQKMSNQADSMVDDDIPF